MALHITEHASMYKPVFLTWQEQRLLHVLQSKTQLQDTTYLQNNQTYTTN